MAYNGLLADKMPRLTEDLLGDLNRKLSFPRGVFSEYPVDDGGHMLSNVDMREKTHEVLDEIYVERVPYLLNTDDELIEILN